MCDLKPTICVASHEFYVTLQQLIKTWEGQLGAQVTTFRVLRVWKPLGVGAGNPYVNGRRNGFGGFGWSE